MNKEEIGARIEELDAEIASLEKTISVDVRPWTTNDHADSLKHWSLLQERWDAKDTLKNASFSPEQRAAVGKRLQAARQASKEAIQTAQNSVSA